jgi:hypothetical protein
MFNPNGTYKWSVDVARSIYTSNPDANTTWEYLYENIKSFCASYNIPCTIIDDGDEKKVIELGDLKMVVMSLGDKWGGISFRDINSLARDILDEAYDMKAVFGLPVSGMMYIEDLLPTATISFMDRKMWQSLDTPEAREFDRKMSWLDSLYSGDD